MANADIPHHLLEHHAYALVDRALHDEDPLDLPFIALAPAFMQGDTRRCPGLVVLRELPRARRIELLEHLQRQCELGEVPLLCALLASQARTDAVRAHLINRLAVIQRSSRRPKQFRFYDPRVFVQLPDILDGTTLAALFGPIEHWTYYLAGAWHTHDKPQVAASPIFHLAPAEYAALARLGIANRVLAQLPTPIGVAGWRAAVRKIDALARRAQAEYGMHHTDDLVTFALHGMRVHARFDSHPTMAALIARSKNQDTTYADATALIDEEDWAQIHRELNTPKENST